MPTVTSEILDRMPPHNLDTEKGVIGSVLLCPDVLHDIGGMVTPEDFYADAHRKIYAVLLDLHRHEGAIDTTMLVDHLRKRGELEAVGGMAYVAEIVHSVAVYHHAPQYAEIIREKSRLRSVIHAATEMLRDAYDPQAEADALVSDCQKKLLNIEEESPEDRAFTAREAAIEAVERLDELKKHSGLASTMTGLKEFDRVIGGLFPGELTILAARPGTGKTSLALQVAYQGAARGRLAVFASLEMGKAELATWQMCAISGVSRQSVRRGDVSEDGVRRFVEAGSVFGETRLMLYERAKMKAADIHRVARRHVRDGLSLLVVDYLQLIEPDDRRTPREQQVATIARSLKGTARQLHIPVLCLCQLNRQAEEGEQPLLKHLRESGAIEQDADVVMFLWRETHEGNEETYLGVAKNRATGDLGKFKLVWVPREARYESACLPNYTDCFDQ